MPEIASNLLLLMLENITSGVHPSLPKRSSLLAHFVKTNQRDLAPVIARRWNENQNLQVNDSTNGSQEHSTIPTDDFCMRIAVEIFSTLSEADRNSIRDAVDREYLHALEKYNEAIRRIYPIITDDRSVDAISDLLQPILSGLEAVTGIKFVAWGGGLIRGGLGILNVSSRAKLYDEAAEHLMIFPKSQADNFEQSALNWMHNVHSNFVYDSRCAVLESADTHCPRAPRNITPQSAYAPWNSEDFTNRVENPPLELPQPALAPTNFTGPGAPEDFANGVEEFPPMLMDSIAREDSEVLVSGAEDPTPEPTPPDTLETANASLPTKRRISNDREEANDQEENTNSKKMCFYYESPQSMLKDTLSERTSHVNATHSHSAQLLPDVTDRESVPPISTLPQTVTPRRHSFPRATQSPLKKTSGNAKTVHGRKSASVSAKPQGTPAEPTETLASLIKKLPSGDKGFLQGLGSIMKVELGPAYSQLLIFLVRLEIKIATHGKSKQKFLDRTFRPNEIKEWIHQGRGRNNRILIIDNVSEFAEQWWAWWTILQLKWRAKDKNGRPVAVIPDSEDWRCLHVPGGNGLICVAAGLYWWGRKLEEAKINTKANKENWNSAVNDCLWVLQRIVSSFDKEALYSGSGHTVHDEGLGDDDTDEEDPLSEGDQLDSSDED